MRIFVFCITLDKWGGERGCVRKSCPVFSNTPVLLLSVQRGQTEDFLACQRSKDVQGCLSSYWCHLLKAPCWRGVIPPSLDHIGPSAIDGLGPAQPSCLTPRLEDKLHLGSHVILQEPGSLLHQVAMGFCLVELGASRKGVVPVQIPHCSLTSSP